VPALVSKAVDEAIEAAATDKAAAVDKAAAELDEALS